METTYQAGYLAELRRPRDYPAVSVLLPTHRRQPDNTQDPIRLRNMIGEARRRLAADPAVSGQQASAVLAGLERAASGVDLIHAADGLALFASAKDASAHLLAHSVAARVEVGGTYVTRDLVADAVRSQRYFALALADGQARLWAGVDGHVVEVRAEGFPVENDRPVGEDAPPGAYGKRRGVLLDERRRQHVREVDQALARVRAKDPRPVIVFAVERHQAFFDEVSEQLDAVIGRVRGSLDEAGGAQIAELAAPVLAAERGRRQRAALRRLVEARGAKLFAGGLTEVRELARQGRGALLLVEEGYQAPAPELAAEELAAGFEDAVDEIVEMTLDDGGEVIFVPDGSLVEEDRIALVLRY